MNITQKKYMLPMFIFALISLANDTSFCQTAHDLIRYDEFFQEVRDILLDENILIAEVYNKDPFGSRPMHGPVTLYRFSNRYVPLNRAVLALRKKAFDWTTLPRSLQETGRKDIRQWLLNVEWLKKSSMPVAHGNNKNIAQNLMEDSVIYIDQNITQYFHYLELLANPSIKKYGLVPNLGLEDTDLDLEQLAFLLGTYKNEIPHVVVKDPYENNERQPKNQELDFGKGLFALDDIEAGTIIGKYVGLVGGLASNTGYNMASKSGFVINAANFGNYTRYINCAQPDDVNVLLVHFTKNEITEPYLVSVKDIEPGQELLFYYGYDSFGDTKFARITPDSRRLLPTQLDQLQPSQEQN
ncbi:MAG: hypothetical protein KDD48_07520 [Bdellovibrionales bacterium]|nr:hypothetical protein [Bdellovibrionales bacterium]